MTTRARSDVRPDDAVEDTARSMGPLDVDDEVERMLASGEDGQMEREDEVTQELGAQRRSPQGQGISNRPLDEEIREQELVPPRNRRQSTTGGDHSER